jgi:arylsulfatase A-like enzyme
LAQVLRESGYHTAAFNSNPWLSSYYNYDRGFGIFDDGIQKWQNAQRARAIIEHRKRLGRLLSPVAHLYKMIAAGSLYKNLFSTAQIINEKALSWLRTSGSLFFIWLHYMDAHEPYLPIPGASMMRSHQLMELDKKARSVPESLSAQEIEYLIRTYDTKIAFVDVMIGALLRSLGQSGHMENTYVVVSADHGQQFLEHGKYAHNGNWVYDELIRVPLIIVGPGIAASIVDRQVSQIDLAPTILDLLGLNKPESFVGHSLLGSVNRMEAIIEADTRVADRDMLQSRPRMNTSNKRVGMRTEGWKYIYTQNQGVELYELEHDRGEKANVRDSQPRVIERFVEKLNFHLEFEQSCNKRDEEDSIRKRVKRFT